MKHKEDVMNVVAYVLDGHNVTETAEYFGVNRALIISLLDEVRIKEGRFYDENLGSLIEETLMILTTNARSLAGIKSKRELVLSEDEVIDCIFEIIFEGATTRELGIKYNCSHTSVSVAIKRLDCPIVVRIVGLARQLRRKFGGNKMYAYMVFKSIFSSDILKNVNDTKAFDILSQIYELAITTYQFKRRNCEDLWTR